MLEHFTFCFKNVLRLQITFLRMTLGGFCLYLFSFLLKSCGLFYHKGQKHKIEIYFLSRSLLGLNYPCLKIVWFLYPQALLQVICVCFV